MRLLAALALLASVTGAQQQSPAPRAAVVHGDSGTVAVWTERDSAWLYIVRPHANAATRINLSLLPRMVDSASHVVGLSPDSAKVLRDPPVLGATTAGVLLDYQVDRQADDVPDSLEPHYPDQLRTARWPGKVFTQFIIDSTGKPVLASFTPILTSHWLFTLAILAALPDMRFRPAQRDGHSVAELVTVPFVFGSRATPVHIGAPHGSATVSFDHDTAWLELTTPQGRFAVHADSFAMASWADSAAHVRAPKPHGAKKSDYSELILSYPDPSVNATVAVGILRLSTDSASPFQFTGANGSWTGQFAMPYDSAQRVFAAMRGLPSTLSVWTDDRMRDDKRDYRDTHSGAMARPKSGSGVPQYPEMLRSQNIEGTVLLSFAVDTAGRVDISSARVLKSSHPDLARSVYRALPDMRFIPARDIDGKTVREMVQEPFAFNLRH